MNKLAVVSQLLRPEICKNDKKLCLYLRKRQIRDHEKYTLYGRRGMGFLIFYICRLVGWANDNVCDIIYDANEMIYVLV